MRCTIDVLKEPPDMTILYKKVTMRERALRRLLGGKIQTTLIVPDGNVRFSLESDPEDEEDGKEV